MNSGKADAPAGDESIHLVTIDWTRDDGDDRAAAQSTV